MRWQLETYISGTLGNKCLRVSLQSSVLPKSCVPPHKRLTCVGFTTKNVSSEPLFHRWMHSGPRPKSQKLCLFPDKVCKTMAGVSKCPREQKFCFQRVRNYRFPSWDQKAGRKSSVYFWFDLNKKCSAIIETHTLVNVVLVFIFALELWFLCPFLEGSQKFTLIVTIKQRCTWNTWQSSHLFCKHLHW